MFHCVNVNYVQLETNKFWAFFGNCSLHFSQLARNKTVNLAQKSHYTVTHERDMTTGERVRM